MKRYAIHLWITSILIVFGSSQVHAECHELTRYVFSKPGYECNNGDINDFEKIPSNAQTIILNNMALGDTLNSCLISRFSDSLVMLRINQGCSLTNIEDSTFKGFKKLRNLYLTGFNLRVVNAYSFHNDLNMLKLLDLYGNKIEYIKNGAFGKLKNLTNLYLNGNNLVKVKANNWFDESKEPIPITTLSLFGNQIDDIYNNSFSRFESLQWLDLSHNKIQLVSSNWFGQDHIIPISTLELHKNKIQLIEDNAFKMLHNLDTLNLSFNDLKELSGFGGRFHSFLLKLILRNNQRLTSVKDSTVKNLKRINVVTLSTDQQKIEKLIGHISDFVDYV